MRQLEIFTILLLSVLFASCNKDSKEATGIGDVLVVAKNVGGSTVYGISIYAYTFNSFQSVTVANNSIADHTYTLKSNQGYKTNFYYETTGAEFTATKPTAATYKFSAVFENGTTDEFEDILSDKVLAPPTITKCEYNTTKHMLEATWTALTNADSYAINIFDGSKAVFGSTELPNTNKTYSVSASGLGWASGFTPESGKTYTVRLYAFLYEPNGDSYNVQATSFAEMSAQWGN
jgi:hypothetical protein